MNPITKLKDWLELYRFKRDVARTLSPVGRKSELFEGFSKRIRRRLPVRGENVKLGKIKGVEERLVRRSLSIKPMSARIPRQKIYIRIRKPEVRLPSVRAPRREIILALVVVLATMAFLSAWRLGYLNFNFSVSSTHGARPAGGSAQPHQNNNDVYVNYLNMMTDFSDNQYVYFTISPSSSSFNVTPGSRETLSFDMSIPKGIQNAPSSVTLTNISVNTTGFSILNETPNPPMTVGGSSTVLLTLVIGTPNSPYYGPLDLVFYLTPNYAATNSSGSPLPGNSSSP